MGKGTEKQHCAPHCSHQYKAPQLPGTPADQEEKHGSPHRQAVTPVQQGGEAGRSDPEGAQQVIQQSGRQSQQNGLPEHQQLMAHLAPHLSKQAAQEAAPAGKLVLIGHGIDPPVHMEFPPIQGQLADV